MKQHFLYALHLAAQGACTLNSILEYLAFRIEWMKVMLVYAFRDYFHLEIQCINNGVSNTREVSASTTAEATNSLISFSFGNQSWKVVHKNIDHSSLLFNLLLFVLFFFLSCATFTSWFGWIALSLAQLVDNSRSHSTSHLFTYSFESMENNRHADT